MNIKHYDFSAFTLEDIRGLYSELAVMENETFSMSRNPFPNEEHVLQLALDYYKLHLQSKIQYMNDVFGGTDNGRE